jgi:hypothetical protein
MVLYRERKKHQTFCLGKKYINPRSIWWISRQGKGFWPLSFCRVVGESMIPPERDPKPPGRSLAFFFGWAMMSLLLDGYVHDV